MKSNHLSVSSADPTSSTNAICIPISPISPLPPVETLLSDAQYAHATGVAPLSTLCYPLPTTTAATLTPPRGLRQRSHSTSSLLHLRQCSPMSQTHLPNVLRDGDMYNAASPSPGMRYRTIGRHTHHNDGSASTPYTAADDTSPNHSQVVSPTRRMLIQPSSSTSLDINSPRDSLRARLISQQLHLPSRSMTGLSSYATTAASHSHDEYVDTKYHKKFNLLRWFSCSTVGKFVQRHSLALTVTLLSLLFLSFSIYHLIERTILWASTGSFLYHHYAWYSMSNAAQRLHPHLFNISHNTHPTLTTDAKQQKHQLAQCLAIDNSVQARISATASQPHLNDIVYVIADDIDWDLLPYTWDTILNSTTASKGGSSQRHNTSSIAYRSHNGKQVLHDSGLNLVPPTPINIDLDKCNVYTSSPSKALPAYCYRQLHKTKLTFQFVKFPFSSDILPHVSRLLIVGDNFASHMLDTLEQQYGNASTPVIPPPHLSIGIISLADEACNNPQSHRPVAEWPHTLHRGLGTAIRLIATPYGDCVLDQLVPRFMMWPLGPAGMHQFPTYLDPSQSPPINERSNLLNMQVTYSQLKPTRMQAYLTANNYCTNLPHRYRVEHLKCYIYNNDLLYKVGAAIDRLLGVKLLGSTTMFADPALHSYLPTLYDSRFTLVPQGKNPTSYRGWEAIMAGSIPIIEDTDLEALELHPYGLHFRCRTDQDAHALLKYSHAPVLFVNEWSELPALLNNINNAQAQQIQHNLAIWYQSFVQLLQTTLVQHLEEM